MLQDPHSIGVAYKISGITNLEVILSPAWMVIGDALGRWDDGLVLDLYKRPPRLAFPFWSRTRTPLEESSERFMVFNLTTLMVAD